MPKINTCGHPDRDYYARDRCRACYQKAWKEANWDRSLSDRAYDSTDAGKERQRRYNESEKGRKRTRKYRQKKAEG